MVGADKRMHRQADVHARLDTMRLGWVGGIMRSGKNMRMYAKSKDSRSQPP